eukprot:6209283-Pleurochrysis_carterae.AAC.1
MHASLLRVHIYVDLPYKSVGRQPRPNSAPQVLPKDAYPSGSPIHVHFTFLNLSTERPLPSISCAPISISNPFGPLSMKMTCILSFSKLYPQ